MDAVIFVGEILESEREGEVLGCLPTCGDIGDDVGRSAPRRNAFGVVAVALGEAVGSSRRDAANLGPPGGIGLLVAQGKRAAQGREARDWLRVGRTAQEERSLGIAVLIGEEARERPRVGQLVVGLELDSGDESVAVVGGDGVVGVGILRDAVDDLVEAGVKDGALEPEAVTASSCAEFVGQGTLWFEVLVAKRDDATAGRDVAREVVHIGGAESLFDAAKERPFVTELVGGVGGKDEGIPIIIAVEGAELRLGIGVAHASIDREPIAKLVSILSEEA